MAHHHAKERTNATAFALFLMLFLLETYSYNVTSYLSKYQIQPTIESNQKNPFKCQNGGRIIRGHADFSMFPTQEDGTLLSFLHESSRAGFHCACPDGYTGLHCGRPFEFCDKTPSASNRNNANSSNNSFLHVCFNHGKCIDGLDEIHPEDQQFCDCSEATLHGKSFTGKYCEQQTTPGLQTCDSQGSKFCVHGECKSTSLSNLTDHNVCECEDGFVGEHCNFRTSEEPACDLDCGPGKCRVTYAHYDDAADYQQYWRHNVNHTFCSCPPGHTGTTCEISAEELASGVGSVDNCDDSMQFFCLNGGICKSNYFESSERPCSCPVGYDGPHCEFKEGEVPDCTLDCKNGGVCTLGIQSIQDAENYTSLWDQSVNKMYCSCPEGHHGVHCEVDLTSMSTSTCGQSNEVFCLEGACDIDRASDQPKCHCKRGYAGESCQYKQNEVPSCALDCQNGDCVLGVKTIADSSDINRLWDSHVNFTYCR